VTALEAPKVTALAPWFGSNRMLAPAVGEELAGCKWVGIPFAGGMSELVYITASTIVVNDKHRHVINLARVVADANLRRQMVARLNRLPFHPDTLAAAQDYCRSFEPKGPADVTLAESYFICCWMGRSGKAGTDGEFSGGLPIRWNANGGDSNTRYRSALRSTAAFQRIMRRCNFDTQDAFEFIDRCEDNERTGIYCDPPFPDAGRKYVHNAGKTDAEERNWHLALKNELERFHKARVVCRFYDHPLVRELYPEPRWTWRTLKGRKQSNAEAPEVLVMNGPSRAKPGNLF
jgi:DNA adenine methylase